MKKRSFLHVLGVDLGGGKGKKTAVAAARIDPHDGTATVVAVSPRRGDRPLYDAALIELLRSYGDGTLVCVDAPLTVPPCLRCTVPVCPGQEACVDPAVIEMRRISEDGDGAHASGHLHLRVAGAAPSGADRHRRRGKPPITPYTQRATEVHLSHERGLTPREAFGQGTGPLAARAAHVVRALADRFRLNENLIEVYPKGTLAVLGFERRYKKHLHERETRAQILESLAPELRFGPGVWRELCVQSDHLFEAVICAYTGFLWARDAWSFPEGSSGTVLQQDGWIWIPPPRSAEDDGTSATAAAAASGEG